MDNSDQSKKETHNKELTAISTPENEDTCIKVKIIPPPDGGWGWMVVASSFLATAIVALNRSSFYVLYMEWVEIFEKDKGFVGWIGSLFSDVGSFLGVIFSALIDLYGCRTPALIGALFMVVGILSSAFVTNINTLFFTYGILGGIGLGITTISALVIVQQYFSKNRALASGIALIGLNVGNMAGAPIVQLLLDHYGWRGTLMIISGISMHLLIISSVYRPLKLKIKKPTKAGKEKQFHIPALRSSFMKIVTGITKNITDFSIFRNIPFTMAVAAAFLSGLSFFSFINHMISHAVYHGIDRQRAALLTTALAFSALISRALTSFLANLDCTNRILLCGCGELFAGISIMLYSFADTYILMMVAGCFIGFLRAIYSTIAGTILVDIVGIDRYPKAQAFRNMTFSSGALIGTPFLGYMFILSGGYHIPLIVAGSLGTVGGVIDTLIYVVHRHINVKTRAESLSTEERDITS